MQKVIECDYPGNFQEMSSIVSNLYIQRDLNGTVSLINNLPFKKREEVVRKPTTNLHKRLLPEVKSHIESLLAFTDGHIGNSAKLAGLAINTFKQKMEECELDIEYFKKKGT
jgi:DNA-binding NtrC family response regulator